MQASPATAHMFIMSPLTGGGLMSLFSTHPPVEKRVERLMAMRGKPFDDGNLVSTGKALRVRAPDAERLDRGVAAPASLLSRPRAPVHRLRRPGEDDVPGSDGGDRAERRRRALFPRRAPEHLPAVPGRGAEGSPATKQVFRVAWETAQRNRRTQIDASDLFLGIFHEVHSIPARILKNYGVDPSVALSRFAAQLRTRRRRSRSSGSGTNFRRTSGPSPST